jgi:hypothetical protein
MGTDEHASEVRRMAAIRAALLAIIILALAVSPLAVPLLGGSSPGDATAYASLVSGGRFSDQAQAPALQDNDNGDDDNDNDDDNGDDDNDNNGDDDDDDNDNNGDDDDDNDNNGDDGDDNDNDDGDDDDGDDNDNDDGDDDDDNDNVRVVVERSNESVNRPTKCFDAREVGVVQLGTGSYDVTVTVMPHSSLNQTTRLTLHSVDPSTGQPPDSVLPGTVPALPGSLVDSVMFDLDAQSSCDGEDINPLPNLVNLGIVYNVPVAVDKSKLQIVRLEGGSWTNVDTVPDPVAGNPYVSATVNMAGTYALIQRP